MFSTKAASDRGFSRTRVSPERAARSRSALVTRALIRMAGKATFRAAQLVDQFDAIDCRHPVVDDQAAAFRQVGGRQHGLGTVVELDVEALDFEGEFQGRSHGGIVIHNNYGFRHG